VADQEHVRLQAIITSQAARIRELEDTLAKCVAKGVALREVLAYYTDAPTIDEQEKTNG
jgi:arginine deiminase